MIRDGTSENKRSNFLSKKLLLPKIDYQLLTFSDTLLKEDPIFNRVFANILIFSTDKQSYIE